MDSTVKKLNISIHLRRIQISLILSFALLLLGGSKLSASHISGGSIKYKSIGGNRYYIEVAYFRDCSGIQITSTTARLVAQCMPSGSPTIYNLNLLPFVAPAAKFGGPYSAVTFTSGSTSFSVEEVSDVCDKVLNPAKTPNTRCRNRSNTILGYTRFKYSGIITLARCNYWRLSSSPPPARNLTNSNISSGSMSVETWFDTRNFQLNSAPDFADEVKPIPSACVGKEVKYGVGTIDNDGDSLRFIVTCAKQNVNACVNYRNGFSATNPADSFSLDPATGLIRFVPKTAGKRVVAFWVKEYERCTGKWKAQTLRDVQFRVQACNNNIPQDLSGITNIQVVDTSKKNYITKTGKYSLQVCNGVEFSFEDTIEDPDVNDTLAFNTNVQRVLPGATMSVQVIKKNKAVVKFRWKAKLGKNPVKIFYLVFNDDRCDYPGNGFNVYNIDVRNSTDAGPDQAICLGADTAFLEASGGKYYQWKSVWGDSLIWTGANKNVWGDTTKLDTNKKIKFLPKTTTYLEVWSDMKAGCSISAACQSRDTVKIVAAKNYNLIKHNDTLICFSDSSIQIFAKPDSTHFKYTYEWNSESPVSNDSINNPYATPIHSQYFYINVKSDSGCAKKDSIYIAVTPPMPEELKATSPISLACSGLSTQINLSLGRLPSKCGSTTSKCVGALKYKSSKSTTNSNGNGPSGTANWPCPYGGAQASSRQQYLYTAAELNSMGITAGTIDGLGFNAVTLNAVGSLGGYSIKMKCVPSNVTSISSMTIAGLTTVFTAKTVTPIKGWNLHPFDVNYDYDGVSNLLVEVCWENTGGATSANSAVAYVGTTSNSVVGYNSSAGACTAQFLSLMSRTNRPTIQFSYCGVRNGSEFTYKWSPATGLNSDTLQNPTANLFKTTKYNVLVTDTFGKCSDTTSITLNIANIDAGNDTSICPNDTIQLTPTLLSACKGVGTFKWTPSQYFPNDSLKAPFVSVPKTTVVSVTYTDTCGCILKDSLTIFSDSIKYSKLTKNPGCGLTNGSIVFSPMGGFKTLTYSIDSGKTWNLDSSFLGLPIGFYNLQIRDSLQCKTSIEPDTIVNGGAPQIDSIKLTNVSCGGFSDGELEVFTSGGIYPLKYSVDSGTTWGATSIIKNLKAGKYKVYVKGKHGCTSFPKYVILTEPDTLFVSFGVSIDSCYQLGNGFARAKALGGTAPYTYTWTGKSPSASHNPVVIHDSIYSKLFAYNKYNLKLKDKNGCGLDSTFTIEEIPEIIIDSTYQIKTTCFNYTDGKIFMRAKGGNSVHNTGLNWQYKFSIDNGSTFFNATNGSNPNLALLDSTKNGGVGGPIGAKWYSLVVIDGKGCTGSKRIEVLQPPEMLLTAPLDSIRICVSSCAKLEVFSTGGNNPNHNYHWTPTISNTNVANVCPKQNSLYSVYATDKKGCASNGKILKVNLFDSLQVEVSDDTSICMGSYAKLNAMVTGGEGKNFEYLWQPFTALSNGFIKNPNASPKTETNYVVQIKDKCGSPAVYDSVRIKILPQPKVAFSADSLKSCPPLYTEFRNNTNSSTYCKWDFGDGTVTETCSNVHKTYSRSGKYSVKLTVVSSEGCKDSLIKDNYIHIYPVPVASFSMSPQPTTILETNISFKDESAGRIVNWEWNFAGIDTSKKRNPKFFFSDEKDGTYPVRLDVYSNLGCTDDTIRVVTINSEYYLYVPTSFTPNNDGKNDRWKPMGIGFEKDYYLITVFDRWGKLIFESYDYNEYWDGTTIETKEIVPNGVYTWKIVTGDKKELKNRHVKYGNVTIIK